MRDDAEQHVAEFIRRHELFAGTGRIVLAVSGGADSIALLRILHALRADGCIGAELVCAHVNHQLRGAASDGDARFVIEQATRLGLPVVMRTVDVRAAAKACRLSIETAARELRLEALSKIAKDHRCFWVATGHQKNDNAETVIQRLARGTGIRGLGGIRPASRFAGGLWLARPLLGLTREQIIAYLKARGLAWREDHTNIDPAHRRNYIRHKLLPYLQQPSKGSLVEELSDLAAAAGRLYQRIQADAERAFSELAESVHDSIVIRASALSSLAEPVAVELIRQALVRLGCRESDLTEDHYKSILQLAREPLIAKARTLPGGFIARREAGQLVLAGPVHRRPQGHPSGDAQPVTLRIPGETEFTGYQIEARILNRDAVPSGKIKGDKSPWCEYLDLDRVGQPLVVRPRRAGDTFHPLGLAGPKKLGKFLTTAKVPPEVREHLLVFTDREKIVWVCPVRIAESAKIADRTRLVLMLRVTRA